MTDRSAPTIAAAQSTTRPLLSAASGAIAMVFVGGSAAASRLLVHAPLFAAQALRYALACLLLLALARWNRQRLAWPRGSQWLWLVGISGCGLVVFNLALVRGSAHAEPAVLGVAVACVPVLLAAVGPLLERRHPTRRVLAAAGIVTVGAALVQGLGHSDLVGLGWAVVVFACEAAFTLLAVPVLPAHGAYGVSVHTTWLATVAFAVISLLDEGPGAVTRLTAAEVWATVYLAVGVTAVAFVLWYGAVHRLGAGRAGLLTGVAPVAAAVGGVALGGPVPSPMVWVGVFVVAGGLAVGLTARDRLRRHADPSGAVALVATEER